MGGILCSNLWMDALVYDIGCGSNLCRQWVAKDSTGSFYQQLPQIFLQLRILVFEMLHLVNVTFNIQLLRRNGKHESKHPNVRTKIWTNKNFARQQSSCSVAL
jgi:hypothetical protein